LSTDIEAAMRNYGGDGDLEITPHDVAVLRCATAFLNMHTPIMFVIM
jgi:hypothetical protein